MNQPIGPDRVPCDPAGPHMPPDPCTISWRRSRDHLTPIATGSAPLMEEITPAPTPPIPKFRARGQEAEQIERRYIPFVTQIVPPGYVGIDVRIRVNLSDPVASDVVRFGLLSGTSSVQVGIRPEMTFDRRIPLLGYKADGNKPLALAAEILPRAWSVPADPTQDIGTAPLRTQIHAYGEMELFVVAEAVVAEFEACLKEKRRNQITDAYSDWVAGRPS